MVGGSFLESICGKMQEVINELSLRRSSHGQSVPFMLQYYNVKLFCHTQSKAVKPAIARIVNSTIDALNDEMRLPKYLVVILDRDILDDFHDEDCDF